MRALVVAPLAGARIETPKPATAPPTPNVAPLAGARIETSATMRVTAQTQRRSPRGSAN